MVFQWMVAAIGVWLTAAPDLLNLPHPARGNFHIVGPMIASFGVIAVWEVTRDLRWLNVILGFWLAVAPFVLGYGGAAMGCSLGLGLSAAVLSLFEGQRKEAFGGGWASLAGKGTNR